MQASVLLFSVTLDPILACPHALFRALQHIQWVAIVKAILNALLVLAPLLPVLPLVCLAAARALPTSLKHAPAQAHLSAILNSATLQLTLVHLHALPLQLQDLILLAAIVRAVLNVLLALVIPQELISAPPTVLAQQTCSIPANVRAQASVLPFSVILDPILACPHALCRALQHILWVAIVKAILNALLVLAIPLPVLPLVCLAAARAPPTLPRLVLAQAHLSAILNSATLQATLANHLVLLPHLQGLIRLVVIVKAILNALLALVIPQ